MNFKTFLHVSTQIQNLYILYIKIEELYYILLQSIRCTSKTNILFREGQRCTVGIY